MGSQAKDLYEFFADAELSHYYDAFKNDLKIVSLAQLKYVEEEDLNDMGMTRPEQRRLKKYFKKEYPQGTFGKLKKLMSRNNSDYSNQRSPESDHSPTSRPLGGMRSPGGRHIIPPDSIQVLKTLGSGEFGLVQQGVWTNEDGDRIQVAIKCLSKEQLHQGMANFLKEANIMHTLVHENIVQFYGVVLGRETSLMLVTELAPLRSLLECLKEPTLRPSFTVPVLCDFALQVATGMAFLENSRLIHRDLAARNILVFAKNKVKISDFGLSRAMGVGKDYYQTNFNVNLKLPIAWCAPECIKYLKFTSASDVWAYGVTLWEMFSYGFQPWRAFNGEQQANVTLTNGDSQINPEEISNQILEAIDEPNCQRLEKPDCCPKDFYSLMLKCWEHVPDKRPRFFEIMGQLPMINPVQVQTTADFSMSPTNPMKKDMLVYKTTDIITVLDNKPHNAPDWKLWKGVINTGKTGFFDPNNTRPYIETKLPPQLQKKVSRRLSLRKNSISKPGKLRPDMISRPQNDLRHTGHIGYDGAVFGDVSFIGDNYDKLPIKVVNPYEPYRDNHSIDQSPLLKKSEFHQMSNNSLQSDSQSQWTISSVNSANSDSSDFFNDWTSTRQNGDSVDSKTDDRQADGYLELVDDLDDFKFPDLSLSTSLDFGTSFIDDMMKAFNTDKKDSSKSSESDTTRSSAERDVSSPERDLPSSGGHSSEDKDSNEDCKMKHSKSEKKRNKLAKLSIGKDEPRMAKVKPMSASDERKLDDAIAKANEFAAKSTEEDPYTPRTPKTPKPLESNEDESDSGSESTHKQRSKFSFKFPSVKKSPKVEKRNFSEQLENAPNVNEDMSPEAQDAYNMLVVKGVTTESAESISSHSSPTSPRISSQTKRERRMRRSIEHQQRGSLTGEDNVLGVSSLLATDTSHMTRNMKDPAGIPSSMNADHDQGSVNPLRMLRNSSAMVPRIPRGTRQMASRTSSNDTDPGNRGGMRFPTTRSMSIDTDARGSRYVDTDFRSGAGNKYSANATVASYDKAGHRPLLPDAKHISRVRDFTDVDRGFDQHYDNRVDGEVNPLPLPPKPTRPSALYQKPRERRYPLLTDTNGHAAERPRDTPPAPPIVAPIASAEDEEEENDTETVSQRGFSSSHRSLVPNPHVAMKFVKCNAQDMGLHSNDPFWKETVDLEGASKQRPLAAGYKTSDNVSYEDLLDFALDTKNKPKGDPNCPEVEVMQKVLSKQVPVSVCVQALEETAWDVPNAIKYIKMKQLLSTQLGDIERCKEALLACQWDVQEAANYMLVRDPQPSPECIDL